MEINHLLKAGFGRRGFLSGSSLLLTGALLGAAEEARRSPRRFLRLRKPFRKTSRTKTLCSRIWSPRITSCRIREWWTVTGT